MRCTWRVASAVMAVLVGGEAKAVAQPGNAPLVSPLPTAPAPAPGPMPGARSPGVALALSLGATAGCAGFGLVADETGDDEWAAVGGLCLWVMPSAGHWYAGRWWTNGMTLRTAALGSVFVIAPLFPERCEVGSTCEGVGVGLSVGIVLAFFGGAIWDIATAPGQARTYNARLRQRATSTWTIAPLLAPDRTGVALTGRF